MKHINIHTEYSFLTECIILVYRFMVIAPGMVMGQEQALMSLAKHEDTLFDQRIIFCSPYRHLFANIANETLLTTREEEETVQQALHESLWRACCPSRMFKKFRSREHIQHFAETPMMSPFNYFCQYTPIEETSNEGARGPQH